MEIITHHTISDLYKYLDLTFEPETDFTIHFKLDILKQIPFHSPIFFFVPSGVTPDGGENIFT